MSESNWPAWWAWEIELTPHLEKRMEDRDFTELDLREMMERAAAVRRDVIAGRWILETAHAGRPWEVVVEPDEGARLLVVVTAYPVEA